MSYSEQLLTQFTELFEKHDALDKLNSREILHNYGFSEIHCIYLIGNLEQPNVTKISLELSMTKSAISRIAKKLLDNGDIESYQVECNKKEIYYKLTPKGQELFDEHLKIHSSGRERDKKFFEEFDDNDLHIVSEFLSQYNKYLEVQIEKLK
ncbi:MarR family transcriptional regulator [Clostridium chromiireducens]|uniref:MarR family transcriptional regulator n=1 Tax=Clostridium chromiireducens TaxID=225345 RepID=UPI003AF96E7A